MREKDLEQVMRRFVTHEVDILVSTLIVESGLDVPNANTIIINRADRFGLAQLYQLRGRVGRSHRRAYCYLIVPDQVDEEAERRLKVLEHHTELGAGYRVALKDMELRGAGNLLGSQQSGFVHAVGFDLYLRMLEQTVQRIQLGDDAPPTCRSTCRRGFRQYILPEKLEIYWRPPRRRRRGDRPVAGRGPRPVRAAPAVSNLLASGIMRLVGRLGSRAPWCTGRRRVLTSATPPFRCSGLPAAFGRSVQGEVRRPIRSRSAHPLGGAVIIDGYACPATAQHLVAAAVGHPVPRHLRSCSSPATRPVPRPHQRTPQ
jgi:transcription-repair coupling factor (superfamily II helicase)